MKLNAFRAIADLAVGAKKREDEEYKQFLAFYRELVETLPAEAAKIFDSVRRLVIDEEGKEATWTLKLTATDFIWWKRRIDGGSRFKNGIEKTQLAILEQLAEKAEAKPLPPEARKALLALLDEATA